MKIRHKQWCSQWASTRANAPSKTFSKNVKVLEIPHLLLQTV